MDRILNPNPHERVDGVCTREGFLWYDVSCNPKFTRKGPSMDNIYLNELIDAIGSFFKMDFQNSKSRWNLLSILSGPLGYDSIFDLAKTECLPKDQFYRSIEIINHHSLLTSIRRIGRLRLSQHLKRMKEMSEATRSRERVIFCADDFNSRRRGSLDDLTYFWWNGSQKRVTLGLSLQVLAAVIGDGKETIILDVRLVLPPHDGPGVQPAKKTEWLKSSLRSLDIHLGCQSLNFEDCVLSVDSAYVSPCVLDEVKNISLPMVSTLSMTRKIIGPIFEDKITLEAPAKIWLNFWGFLNSHRMRGMWNEPGITYLRQTVDVPSIGTVLLIYADRGNEDAIMFSTKLTMKAQTVVQTARRRWQLERVFWNLQQNLGVGSIRHTDRKKTLSRLWEAFVIHIAFQTVARHHRLSMGELCVLLHRHRKVVISQILAGKSLSEVNLAESVRLLPLAA